MRMPPQAWFPFTFEGDIVIFTSKVLRMERNFALGWTISTDCYRPDLDAGRWGVLNWHLNHILGFTLMLECVKNLGNSGVKGIKFACRKLMHLRRRGSECLEYDSVPSPQVLIPSACPCGLIWKQGLCSSRKIKMKCTGSGSALAKWLIRLQGERNLDTEEDTGKVK